MKCYLAELLDGSAEVFIQYRDEWTQEEPAGRTSREPGVIPIAFLANSRAAGCSDAERVLGREVEWLPEPCPESMWRAIGREAIALVVALGAWTELSLPIVALVWRVAPSGTSFLFILVPIYLPAPVAAFVYVLPVHPRTHDKRATRAMSLAALG
jgi:hypothetical protein